MSAIEKTQPTQLNLIPRKELSARLGISQATASRLGKRGVLKEVWIGGRVRYNWEDVVSSLPTTSQIVRNGK